MDEDEFYATFYCASVTRCYPGRHPSGRGDRRPTPQEIALCAPWRESELRLLSPRLVVPVEVRELSTWRPMTDLLLETPNAALLIQTPRLDESILPITPILEDNQ